MATHVKSFDLVGKKEAIADVISMITPTDTPFLSSIGTEKITNTYFQWLEDELRAVAKNTTLEGADAVDTDRDQPSFRENSTQILSETFKVSGTSEAVKLYGRESVVAYETAKTGKLVKMDLEHSLVGTRQTRVAAAAATEGEFAGVQAMIHADVTTDILSGDTTASVLAEDDVVDTHEKLYNEGSDATILMVIPSLTKTISGWAQSSARTLNVDQKEKKLSNVINVYESPFGTLRVVKNRRMYNEPTDTGATIPGSDALLYTPEQWKLMVLRAWFREKLAKTGDADRWMVVGEYSLKHKNFRASALIEGIGGSTPA
jgi:hypothetical protein